MTQDLNTASKNDVADNKPDHSLLPKAFLDEVAYVMMAGEKKYGRYNYTKGHKTSQLISAASRHLSAYMSGEDYDEELSLKTQRLTSHLACVAANMLMLIHQLDMGTHIDDRLSPTYRGIPVDMNNPIGQARTRQELDDYLAMETRLMNEMSGPEWDDDEIYVCHCCDCAECTKKDCNNCSVSHTDVRPTTRDEKIVNPGKYYTALSEPIEDDASEPLIWRGPVSKR